MIQSLSSVRTFFRILAYMIDLRIVCTVLGHAIANSMAESDLVK